MATAQLFERPTSMSNDIRSILDRLATVEGRLSPAQQKVPQLPALFKPKHIRALGAKTDPAHPMDGYMVGDSAEPRRTALEEAMAEIEEDMISKVKQDLTQYLDRLEKKVSVNRDLKDKAKDAVKRGRAEEEIEEVDAVSNPGDPGNDSIESMQGYDPKTAGGISNPGDPGNDSIESMQGYDPKHQPDDRIVDPMEEDELKAIRRLAFGKEELDELDFSGSTPTQAQTDQFNAVNAAAGSAADQMVKGGKPLDLAKSLYNVADATGSKGDAAWTGAKALGSAALAKVTGNDPAAAAANSVAKSIVGPLSGVDTKQVAATAQQYRGPNAKDITKDPQFAKLPLAKQQQVIQAQQQIRDMGDDDFANVQNFDAKQTQADLARVMQPSKPDPNRGADLASPATYAALGIERPDPASLIAPKATTPAPAPAPTTPTPAPAPAPAPKATTTTPAATFEMADGKSLGCYGDDDQGYELRHGERVLPSRFKNLDDAGMAVKLYRARRQAQQRNSNTDYIEER